MKIERINKIRNHRVFRDFSWPSDLLGFKDYNLIYGWNGSGKTILSNLFRSIELKESISPGEMEITIGGKSINSFSIPTEDNLPKVRVFNRNYIDANVWNVEESISPIFFLGEISIEKQKEIDSLRKQMTQLQDDIAKMTKTRATNERELDNFYINKAKMIKDLLSSSGYNPYNNYNKGDFKAKCSKLASYKDISSYIQSEEETNRLKKQKEEIPKEKVILITFTFVDLNSSYSEIEILISRTVVSRVIDSLKSDAELAAWVQQGLTMHQEKQSISCLFCGKRLPEGHLQHLEEHFNEEFIKFQKEISAKIVEIQSYIGLAKSFTYPDKTAIYDHLASDYAAAIQQLKDQISEYCDALRKLKDALNGKLEKLFEVQKLEIKMPEIRTADIENVNQYLTQHNQETDDFTKSVSAAREKLENSYAAESLDVYNEKKDTIRKLAAECQTLQNTVNELQLKIDKLELQIIEHRRPAEELNNELRSYLGHDELKFEIRDSGYKIIRDGRIADAISEGEKTAIAFLYFLKSLRDKNFNMRNGVVVVDDPVSSLDANSLFNAFGYMKEHTIGAGQIFILTHNFSFFRQIRNWFNHLKYQRSPNPDRHPARFYMLECMMEEGKRNAHIRELDPLLRKYDSEYHYLFSLIYNAATTGETSDASIELEQYYNLPNVARRFLESFLAFRRPKDTGHLDKQLEAIKYNSGKKTRILRFLHTYSHEAQISDPAYDLSILAETKSILSDVLELVSEEDNKHYQEMENLLGERENSED